MATARVTAYVRPNLHFLAMKEKAFTTLRDKDRSTGATTPDFHLDVINPKMSAIAVADDHSRTVRPCNIYTNILQSLPPVSPNISGMLVRIELANTGKVAPSHHHLTMYSLMSFISRLESNVAKSLACARIKFYVGTPSENAVKMSYFLPVHPAEKRSYADLMESIETIILEEFTSGFGADSGAVKTQSREIVSVSRLKLGSQETETLIEDLAGFESEGTDLNGMRGKYSRLLSHDPFTADPTRQYDFTTFEAGIEIRDSKSGLVADRVVPTRSKRVFSPGEISTSPQILSSIGQAKKLEEPALDEWLRHSGYAQAAAPRDDR